MCQYNTWWHRLNNLTKVFVHLLFITLSGFTVWDLTYTLSQAKTKAKHLIYSIIYVPEIILYHGIYFISRIPPSPSTRGSTIANRGIHRKWFTFSVSVFSSVADTGETSHVDLPTRECFQAVLVSITLSLSHFSLMVILLLNPWLICALSPSGGVLTAHSLSLMYEHVFSFHNLWVWTLFGVFDSLIKCSDSQKLSILNYLFP